MSGSERNTCECILWVFVGLVLLKDYLVSAYYAGCYEDIPVIIVGSLVWILDMSILVHIGCLFVMALGLLFFSHALSGRHPKE